MLMRKWAYILAVAAAAASGGATSASAVIFDLTSNHCTTQSACGAPGQVFGTVEVTQSGLSDGTGTVNITVDLLNPPYVYAVTGSADFALFKFNATGVAVGDITVDPTISGQTLLAAAGAFNGDGTGNFSFGIFCRTDAPAGTNQGTGCDNGIQTFSDNLVFHIANATIADLTAKNNLNNIFVADLGCSTSTGGICTQGATGPIDASVPGPIVGAGLPGLVMACGGLLGFARRRRRQNIA